MATKWTEAQSDAINVRSRDILVSAAAGSGKTAVLTERILTRITDKDNPVDLSRLLVVTYTKAAASELRTRISAKLNEAVAANPGNRALTRQVSKLSSAHISTIHSFCYDIVKSNFQVLGLSASVRIADAHDEKLIKTTQMNETIEYFCADGKDKMTDANMLFDNFCSNGNYDLLTESFLDIYDKLNNEKNGIESLVKTAQEMGDIPNHDYTGSAWGRVSMSRIGDFLIHYKSIYEKAIEDIINDDKVRDKYYRQFQYDYETIICLIENINDFTKMCSIINGYTNERLGSPKYADPIFAFYKNERTQFIAELKKIRSKYFGYAYEYLNYSSVAISSIVSDLYVLMQEFDRRITAEKKRRGIVGFSDLERYSYRLLYKDGSLTDDARAYRERFDEIYIDEYQDTNELQDAIFHAVASPRSLFMVGDIKQSIYQFRGAEPSLFSHYRDSFPPYDKSESESNTIFLSKNFRSDETVINFANAVSEKIFTNSSGAVNYCQEDNLIFGKTEEYLALPVEVTLVENDNNLKNMTEPVYVASRIRSLIDNEGFRPKDITILLRSVAKKAYLYEDALREYGIPYYSEAEDDYFSKPEILLMLNLLNVVDNPSRDIYLAGALRSPIFGFTLNELTQIRISHKSSRTLYEAVKAEHNENPTSKTKYFFECLSRWREAARRSPVDRLIRMLMDESGIMNVIYKDSDEFTSEAARRNLIMLYEHSRNFESASFCGLYNFLRYLDDLVENGESVENSKSNSETGDNVRIMTIHKSKGLEFNVCFICNCEKSVCGNEGGGSEKKRFVHKYNKKLGFGFSLKEKDSFIRQNTLTEFSVDDSNTANRIDEEMRLLYVAMTRAKHKLIVTAKVNKPDELIDTCKLKSQSLSRYLYANKPNYIKWILYSAGDNVAQIKSVKIPLSEDNQKECEDGIDTPDNREPVGEEIKNSREYSEYKELFEERFDFVYPHEKLTRVPTKLAVSHLYPRILEDNDDATPMLEKQQISVRKPRFLQAADIIPFGEAAERGSATHAFMQFCDYSLLEKNGIDSEIERMQLLGFINEAQASLIEREPALKFFDTTLYSEIKSSDYVRREHRFNVCLPADEFVEDEDDKNALKGEKILVQGAIDLFYRDKSGKLIIVDFKTDKLFGMSAEKGREELIQRHRAQLRYYREALLRISGQDVGKPLLYSFYLGETIEIN